MNPEDNFFEDLIVWAYKMPLKAVEHFYPDEIKIKRKKFYELISQTSPHPLPHSPESQPQHQ